MKPILNTLYPNWKAIYDMPESSEKMKGMRLIKSMARGNLSWFIRSLIGGVLTDSDKSIKKWIADGEMLEPSMMSRMRRYEATRSRN